MKVEGDFVQGGKEHEMPTHHNLDRYLEEYIQTACIAEDRKGPLFAPRAADLAS